MLLSAEKIQQVFRKENRFAHPSFRCRCIHGGCACYGVFFRTDYRQRNFELLKQCCLHYRRRPLFRVVRLRNKDDMAEKGVCFSVCFMRSTVHYNVCQFLFGNVSHEGGAAYIRQLQHCRIQCRFGMYHYTVAVFVFSEILSADRTEYG